MKKKRERQRIKTKYYLISLGGAMLCFALCFFAYSTNLKRTTTEEIYTSMKRDATYIETRMEEVYTQMTNNAQSVGYTTAVQKILFSDYASDKVKNITTSRELLANTKDQSNYILDLFYYSDGGHLYTISEYYADFHHNMEKYNFDRRIQLDHIFMSEDIIKEKDATYFFIYVPIYRTAPGIAHRNKTNGLCTILADFADVCPEASEILSSDYATYLLYDDVIISSANTDDRISINDVLMSTSDKGKREIGGKVALTHANVRNNWRVVCIAPDASALYRPFYKDTNFYLYIAASLVVYAIAMFYFQRLQARQREALVRQQLLSATIAEQEARLSAYRSQINPHFFFNTLECVRSMAQYYKADMIEDIVTAMSKTFRYSLYSEMVVSLDREVDMLDQYFVITSYRFPDKYELKKEIDEKALSYRVPSMILQPLVENAIKHAFKDAKKKDKNVITVKCDINDEILDIRIRDNGCGMSPEKLKELIDNNLTKEDSMTSGKDSIGIRNIYERIKLFDSRNEMTFDSKEGEYTEIKLILYPADK